MDIILQKIAGIVLTPLIALMGFAGYDIPKQNVGASNTIVTPVALFETSLASSITSSATSMTLVSATTKDGTALASSTYGFIIDEGTVSQEFVRADCTGTTCTNMERGLSVLTGTSTIASLQKAHRRGATVKITDAPLILTLANALNGSQNIPRPIKYAPETSLPTTTIATSRQNLVSVGLLNDTAFNGAGVISANTTSRGVVELATDLEVASSTASGSSGPLVISPTSATSTWTSSTLNALKIPVAQNNGLIDSRWISTSTLFSNATFTGTTTISNSTGTTTIAGNLLVTGTTTVNLSQTSLGDIATGVATYDISTPGTQTIAHGLGVIPRLVKVTIVMANASQAHSSVAFGVYNAGSAKEINYHNDAGGTNSSTANNMTIYYDNSNTAQAALTAPDRTNFYISWTESGAAQGTARILWEAYE